MKTKKIDRAWCGLLLAVFVLLGGMATSQAVADEPSLEIVTLLPAVGSGQTVSWGDVDGDGDLDLAIGSYDQNQVYRNMGDGIFSLAWTSPDSVNTSGLVWGDFDGDGDLDLAAGNEQQDQVFRNDGPAPAGDEWLFTLAWQSTFYTWKTTRSIAAGDYDGDGDLDLVVGNWRNGPGNSPNEIHRNDTPPGGALTFTEFQPAAWSSAVPAYTMSVAWGDMDGDGDLDLAVANNDQTNQVFRNDSLPGGVPDFVLAWESVGNVRGTQSVAWGDYDGDGDLDLAFGNSRELNQVYRNDGPAVTAGLPWSFAPAWEALIARPTTGVAWGDMDGDGDLDLITANVGGNGERVNQVFDNDGGGVFSLVWEATDVPTTDLAVGDMDGDGDLDLVAVNDLGFPNEIFRNHGGGSFVAQAMDLLGGSYQSMAWGDYDLDGDLDLAVGQSGYLRTYRNDGNGALSTHVNLYISPLRANSVAWGDMDADGDLDLAVGNCEYPTPAPRRNQVYRNDGSGNLTPLDVSAIQDCTASVAWGDYDLDGDLDLAVGNNASPNLVYDNNGDGTFILAWTAPAIGLTQSVAWGDYDGDGDLDLAVGNSDSANQIYRNDGVGIFNLAWEADSGTNTFSVAWADYDGDDDLDLAAGNWGRPSVIYRNDGSDAFVLGWNSMESRLISSLAWGDPDGDGDLDLAAGAGASDQGIHLYSNETSGFFTRTTIQDLGDTMGLTWSDFDRDGDPDLAIESSGETYANMRLGGKRMPNNAPQLTVAWPDGSSGADFYASPAILENSVIPIPYTLYDPEGEPAGRLEASYSLNGGGKWHPAIAAGGTVTTNVPATGLVREARAYEPEQAIPDSPGGPLTVNLAVADSGTIADVEVWLSLAHTRDSDLSAVLISPAGTSVILFDSVGGVGQDFVGTVLDDHVSVPIASGAAPFTGVYRPQDSFLPLLGQSMAGTWQLVITDQAGGETGSLAGWGLRIKPQPVAQNFLWDTFASGFFGQSDNVVFRLEAYPTPEQAGSLGTYHYAGGAAEPYQWSTVFATSFPFRVRGTQVRVLSDTLPVEGAWVYRIPAGQTGRGYPLVDASGQPYTTDAAGYLRGHGTVAIGDTLVAMLPVSNTETFTLYHTNATPTATGLQAHTVTAPGVQTLAIFVDHPLLLFDLDVSLQWDAREDSRFLAPFEFNLQRVSELLYDWTDGQAALGQMTVYHNRGNWNEAHLRVYASNRRRPSAVQGGIVADVISDADVSSIDYAPGQVHMGAVWNRYGEPGNSLGEDWARTLAHELGHYAFFLDDNYLGFDAGGQIIPVDTCSGAMADPYRQDYPYDEFHPATGWLPGCEQTLSHQLTGRSDWETIETYYPWLDGTLANLGPSGLPLEVMQLTYVEPGSPSAALEDPTFYLSEGGARVQPGTGTRAFLYQDNWAVDLGQPTLDHILARGARPGDQVCVYEPNAERLGCELVSAADEQLEMVTFTGWQPDVAVSPVNSTTLTIQVTNVPADVSGMDAQLYPLTAPASGAITLNAITDGYSGTFHLAEPAFEGYVRVWADEAPPRREMITDYAVGGNPVSMRGSHVSMRGSHVSMRGSHAPVTSADGQVILFVDATSFQADEFYTLQAVTAIPSPLPWATVVGQGYRLSASAQAPDLAGASVSFGYMGDDVPVGGEPWLKIYYWDGSTWQQLSTTLDIYHNSASAPVQGEGMYVLMASVELGLYGPGWNLVSYPLYATMPVTQAMESISGHFTTVYGYEPTDVADPWKLYDVTVPTWVNDLENLKYDHGYWINASGTVTWSLPVGEQADMSLQSGFSSPPATYYGRVHPNDGFAPAAGMVVAAWIDDHLCGQGLTMEIDGEIVYAVNVEAAAGCGTSGAEVIFQVDNQLMAGPAIWNNDQVLPFDLRPTGQYRTYLPLIRK